MEPAHDFHHHADIPVVQNIVERFGETILIGAVGEIAQVEDACDLHRAAAFFHETLVIFIKDFHGAGADHTVAHNCNRYHFHSSPRCRCECCFLRALRLDLGRNDSRGRGSAAGGGYIVLFCRNLLD